jgi:serine/threonine protein kinase
MGMVYEAMHEGLARKVAVKVLRDNLSDDPTQLQRFQLEARAAAALGHPHIVEVTDFQIAPGERPFLVMELLTGRSLRQLVNEQGRLDGTRAARISLQILSALRVTHAANIVHRDIKPDNIFVLSSADHRDFVKVLDFGIAKLLGEDNDGPKTRAGAVMGTPSYMAPEQALGGAVDHRTDLYAVAACMYFALSGRRPFEGSVTDILMAVATSEPAPLDAAGMVLDPGLQAIVERGLKKSTALRFQSAELMAEALERWLAGEPMPPPTVDGLSRTVPLASRPPPAFVTTAPLVAPKLGTSTPPVAVAPSPPTLLEAGLSHRRHPALMPRRAPTPRIQPVQRRRAAKATSADVALIIFVVCIAFLFLSAFGAGCVTCLNLRKPSPTLTPR